jgi:hypothetical protein
MRFRRRSGFRRTSGKRRKLAWGHASTHGVVPGDVTPGTILLGSHWAQPPAGVTVPGTDNVQPDDYTLVKTLNAISMSVIPAAASTGQAIFTLTAGLIVWEGITGADLDLDPLTLPFPTVEGDADWIWTVYFPFAGPVQNVAAYETDQPGFMEALHTRSQRKLSSRQGILLVAGIDNSPQSDVTLVDFTVEWQSRALFKLP